MTRGQRYKHDTFVRVRDYGLAHAALFPESSTGSQRFAQVTAAVAALDDHLKNRVVARAEARKVKAATREAVYDGMKTLALVARRVMRPEPGANPFRMPRKKTLEAVIATARAFIAEGEKRQDQFVAFGLPPAFLGEFRAQVDALQRAVDVRLNSKTMRSQAQGGIDAALAQGLDAIRDLDAIVAIATRDDRAAFAAWQSARRIEGQGAWTAGTEGEPAADIELTLPAEAPAPAAAEAPEPALALGRAS
jgi:hypothetical protein